MVPGSVSYRRQVLAGLGATALGASAGCLDFFREVGSTGPTQLSVNVTTLPADDDTASSRIARQLVDNLSEAGINATIDPREDEQALRALLLDNDYDIFVGRHPAITDPDELRTLLHTRYSEEKGWQNPYGVTIPSLDDLLDRQRSESGEQRMQTVTELQKELFDLHPLSVIAYPSKLTAVRTDLVTDTLPGGLTTRNDYLRLEAANPERDRLLVSLFRPTVTENLNPLVPETGPDSAILDCIYDPLFEWIDGELVPWLAEDVTWTEAENTVTATVRIRPALRWHDETALTTADIGFTYDMLRDTTMGDSDYAIPAPQFRGRSSLVDSVDTLSNREITLEFPDTSIETARRALTVPILPQHEWEDRTERSADHLTTAIETSNEEPIGSGPFIYEDSTEDSDLILSRNEDHFLLDLEDPHERLESLRGDTTFDEIEFEVGVNVGVVLSDIDSGNRDITATSIPPGDVESVQNNYDNTEVLVGEGQEFFVLGFNTRRHPMGNHRFRQTVARLVDRNYIAETVLEGYGQPSDTPLKRTEFVTDEFTWTGQSSLGLFPGKDGAVDPEAARDTFRDAGFRFDDDGNLVV
ncbi:ABC transporter substrate-binding protein [Natranaeroarchaeum aerophilus]|uniref:ABC transporter substrate-binding protein n=1 Tax=Natranaeroarchaeum aerophilus TaxID=2917711 RepID=A0AAE3FR45_9EURY|nr:ABC transporter substrate-binding protein [Natranaeroarchaeum aerophilus]MCL9813803.1 ABC transporter substrate-binding protein [Natranaeroarchaeum aerophilus]